MTDSPKTMISPSGPVRSVGKFPIVLVLLFIGVVVGAVVYTSLHKSPKIRTESPDDKMKSAIRQDQSTKNQGPGYMNVHVPFPGQNALPPGVPNLSNPHQTSSGPIDPAPKNTPKPSRSFSLVPPVLPSPPVPSQGASGLFVGSVDGGLENGTSTPPPLPEGPHPATAVLPPALPNLSGGGQNTPQGKPSSYEQTNMQDQKARFLKDSQKKQSDILPNPVQDPVSPFEIQAGSVIHAELVTGINSDLPGEVTAQVTGNIYDSINEQFLLIPQGSKIVGKYDSKVAVGQTRVLMAWERILFPDGRSIDLSGMPGVDLEGYAGFHDLVDNHYLKIFGNAILMSLVMAGAQMSQPGGGYGLGGMNSFSNPSMGQAAIGSVGQNMSMTMEQYLGNTMNIQPTLKIRPGYRFDVTVTKDMVFPGPYLMKGE